MLTVSEGSSIFIMAGSMVAGRPAGSYGIRAVAENLQLIHRQQGERERERERERQRERDRERDREREHSIQ